MEKGDFATWMSKVPDLTPLQVQELLDRLKILKKMPSSFVGPEVDAGDWLFDGMVLVLKEKGLINPSAIRGIRMGSAYRSFKKISPEMRRAIERIAKQQLKSSQLSTVRCMQLGVMVSRCLAAWCEKRKITPGLTILMNNAHRWLEAIEESYPGYLGSNMLPLILGERDVLPAVS